MVPVNEPPVTSPPYNLVPAMRASLRAKLERLISRPIIGKIERLPLVSSGGDVDTTERYRVRIAIDYQNRWRGREKEVITSMRGAIEESVSFLTAEQKSHLERSPLDFLTQRPSPPASELVSFEVEEIRGSEQVIELVLAVGPESTIGLQYVALLPNKVQIERQLDALQVIESATDDSPLAPLRALVGLAAPSQLEPGPATADSRGLLSLTGERLDEHQLDCVHKAMATPHFALIQGPPGSGKTTVIKSIVRRTLDRGERVIVVSPTHVAVDNVVEKLGTSPEEAAGQIERSSLPVRYAAHASRISPRARHYWVGGRGEERRHTIARRIRQQLCARLRLAPALFQSADDRASAYGPLTAALDSVQDVICGTPIGVLSCPAVKLARPGMFDLLIIDEVSKMTLPEFLAIAVKARRWVLVGDPEQLPPHCDCEDHGVTLDAILDPSLELACSAAEYWSTAHSVEHERLLLVAREPAKVAATTHAQIRQVATQRRAPPVSAFDPACTRGRGVRLGGGILVCRPDEIEGVLGDRDGERPARVRLLVERHLSIPGIEKSGVREVEPRDRAQAKIFATAFEEYHKAPWATRSNPQVVRDGRAAACVPFVEAVEALVRHRAQGGSGGSEYRRAIDQIAERFAVNTLSVYDWLMGPPTDFDTSPLRELVALRRAELCRVVRPFVGALRKQYRMHSSLSRVPRELFYFGENLHDGLPGDPRDCRVRLVQVSGDGRQSESNQPEVDEICRLLMPIADAGDAHVMVITPYRKQEELLREAIAGMRHSAAAPTVDIKVCTLDRCQGREAEYVFISLVRRQANTFFDAPKRWNVALTRAKERLFLVGDVDAYRTEARMASVARQYGPGRRVSVVARVVEAYDMQASEIAGGAR